MDPALLREREAFKKRAMAMPTVEKRKARPDESHKPSKKPKPAQKSKSSTDLNYKSMAGSSQFKFGILAKIVKHMKTRHQQGDTFPLTVEEILDETNQLDIGAKHRHWLSTEALLNNPKIEVVEGDKFKYKPVYNIKDRRGLLRLLDKNDQRGLGGVYLEHVEESLPKVDKALKILGDQVIYYTRPHDKKKVLFYNDKSYQFSVDEEIQKLWRGVAVEGIDEKKVEEYLTKQGIASMQDTVQRAPPGPKRKKVANRRRNKNFQKHNDHMGDVLKDYSEEQK